VGLRHRGFRRQAAGLWEAASPLPQRLQGTVAPQQCRLVRRGDGRASPAARTPAGNTVGPARQPRWEQGRGCPARSRQGSPSLPRASLQHCAGAAPPADPTWAQGRKQGSEAPPKRDCARPALGTGRSMGCEEPREPLHRGVNKGVLEDVSELGEGTGPFPPQHTIGNSHRPASPRSQAGKAGGQGQGPAQGTVPVCQGDRGGGTRGAVSPSAGGGRGAGLGQPLHHPQTPPAPSNPASAASRAATAKACDSKAVSGAGGSLEEAGRSNTKR